MRGESLLPQHHGTLVQLGSRLNGHACLLGTRSYISAVAAGSDTTTGAASTRALANVAIIINCD